MDVLHSQHLESINPGSIAFAKESKNGVCRPALLQEYVEPVLPFTRAREDILISVLARRASLSGLEISFA